MEKENRVVSRYFWNIKEYTKDEKINSLKSDIHGLKSSITEISSKLNKIVIDSTLTPPSVSTATQNGVDNIEASASAAVQRVKPDHNAQYLAIKAQVQGVKIPV